MVPSPAPCPFFNGVAFLRPACFWSKTLDVVFAWRKVPPVQSRWIAFILLSELLLLVFLAPARRATWLLFALYMGVL
jgi:hypothetical protein